MSSINPGMGNLPIASSLSGLSSAKKNSSAEKSTQADNSAAKTVDAAQNQNGGLTEAGQSEDRDADGRQLYHTAEEPNETAGSADPNLPNANRPRPKDPAQNRGNQLDLDA